MKKALLYFITESTLYWTNIVVDKQFNLFKFDRNTKKELKTFVKNRINEIRKNYITDDYHFCKTIVPADYVSRKLSLLSEFLNSTVWLRGPESLQTHFFYFPRFSNWIICYEVLLESKAVKTYLGQSI